MGKCAWCKMEFDVSEARRNYNRTFKEAADYDDDFPSKDVCFFCASRETSGNIAEGEEIIELMGSHDWESDD
jgi:hypothetical protein